MNSVDNSLQVIFGEQAFLFQCSSVELKQLVEILFADFEKNRCAVQRETRYQLFTVKNSTTILLRQDEKHLYSGSSEYKLAYALMNDVIYHCIDHNSTQHAIHAGAVWSKDHCILLPGSSGRGKSTLTAWLVSKGYGYLTDELIFLDNSGCVTPFPRPINFKVNESHISWMYHKGEFDKKKIISDENGSMIPHRFFNPAYKNQTHRVTNIVFPKYKKDAGLQFEAISPARSSLFLMESHVNAKNFANQAVSLVAAIVRNCKSYTLTYDSFDNLLSTIQTHIPHKD